MRVDLRVKHDVEARKAAIGLFELGHGYKSAAIALSLPVEAVRRWQEIYRVFGSEVLLRMDGKRDGYTYEQKAAGGRRDLLAHCQRLRAPADSDVHHGGRGGSDSRQDRAQDDARDGDSLRYQTRNGLPQYSSNRGVVGRTLENVIARDFDAGAPWRKLGTFGPGLAAQHASYTSRLEAAGIVQSMSRKANCIDNAATEQLFGHVKDEFYRGREWETFEDFKRDLEEYIVHWNTRRRRVRLKGLTPEEFRNQTLAA